DVVRDLHAGLLRQTFDWADIERAPQRFHFARYDALMAAAATRGLRVMPVLFNPPGFHSSGPPRPSRRGTFPPRRSADLGAFAVGPQGQAQRVRSMLVALNARRQALGLRGVVYFGLRDSPVYPGGHDFWGLHTGLVKTDGKRKPAFGSFEKAAQRLSIPLRSP